ncbi:MAG: hypothetical protein ACJAT2_001739 [Bacteriovoracaceae bacterium]|jgi:hypothetical protein
MCGGDAARAFENNLVTSLDPKVNARLFSTAADGTKTESLLQIVVDPTTGLAKFKKGDEFVKIGPNDTMRFWKTDAKNVRIERYITADAKGQKAVNSFFSKSTKGNVSPDEATQLGQQFKKLSADEQANLVGGIENKLRKGQEITEAEFLIAVKGQTGWRTLDGLLPTHLSTLQDAYRSGDITKVFGKLVEGWKDSNSVVTKSRLSRVYSLLEDQFKNRPPRVIPPTNQASRALADQSSKAGKGTGALIEPPQKGLTTKTPGTEVAERGALTGELLDPPSDLVPSVPRKALDSPFIEGQLVDRPPQGKLDLPATEKLPAKIEANTKTPSTGNGEQLELDLPGGKVADAPNPTKAGAGSTDTPAQLELELTGGKAADNADVPKTPRDNTRRSSDTGNAPKQGELPLESNPKQLELALKGGQTAEEIAAAASKQNRFLSALKNNKLIKPVTLALLGGTDLARCFINPECKLDTVLGIIGLKPTLESIKKEYSFSVKAEEVDGAINCTYKITKKLASDASPKAIENQEVNDKLFASQHLTVTWDPSDSLKGGKTTSGLCKDNSPCSIEKELAQSDVHVGYNAKLLIGEEEAFSDPACKNKGEAKPVVTEKEEEEKEETGEGLSSNVEDLDHYKADEKEGDERAPAAFNPDPWNILGGNTGKKFPLTPPQPLIAPRNPTMYVTPGYY